MSFSPRVIALLGFGEAGSAIARGLCVEGGWRGPSKPGDNAPRRVIAIDTALDKDARGTALGETARALDVAIEDQGVILIIGPVAEFPRQNTRRDTFPLRMRMPRTADVKVTTDKIIGGDAT